MTAAALSRVAALAAGPGRSRPAPPPMTCVRGGRVAAPLPRVLPRVLLRLLPGLLLCVLGADARADTCSITPQNFVFPSISSISGVDVYASANFKVTCSWTNFAGTLLLPNATVCLYLGAGTNSSSTVTNPRQIGSGAMRANYNIYTDATYAPAKIWGGWSGTSTPTPITFTLTKTGGVGTLEQNISLFARLSADATLAGLAVGPDNLNFISDFGAGSSLMQYFFFATGTGACTLGPTMPIPFRVSASVINDCNINIGNLVFPNSTLLTSNVRTTASMAVQCSNSTPYRIALSAGTNGSGATARRMRNLSTTELLSYQISTSLDGASWGDGTGGTTIFSGTGNGGTQTQTVYGMVPAQSTPSPGDYKDTVTATVSF